MTAEGLPTSDDAEALRELARQCRKLAAGGSTAEVRRCFEEMADEYERKAAALEAPAEPAPMPPPAAQ